MPLYVWEAPDDGQKDCPKHVELLLPINKIGTLCILWFCSQRTKIISLFHNTQTISVFQPGLCSIASGVCPASRESASWRCHSVPFTANVRNVWSSRLLRFPLNKYLSRNFYSVTNQESARGDAPHLMTDMTMFWQVRDLTLQEAAIDECEAMMEGWLAGKV